MLLALHVSNVRSSSELVLVKLECQQMNDQKLFSLCGALSEGKYVSTNSFFNAAAPLHMMPESKVNTCLSSYIRTKPSISKLTACFRVAYVVIVNENGSLVSQTVWHQALPVSLASTRITNCASVMGINLANLVKQGPYVVSSCERTVRGRA